MSTHEHNFTAKNAALILVAEDNADQRLIISKNLEADDYQVATAVDGMQALDTYKTISPDIVLLDAMMPEMDGFETCQRIRALPGAEQVPIIMLTALEDEVSVERAFAAGASDYLVKPIHWAVLRIRLRNLLQTQQAEQRFQALAQSATSGIITIDSAGIVWYVNPATEKLFGYAVNEINGQELSFLMPEEFRGLHLKGIQSYLETRQPKVIGKTVEVQGLRKNGEIFPMELSLSVSELNGEVSFTGIIRDISERVQAEEEMRKSREHFELLFDAAPDAYYLNDLKGTFIDGNRAAEKLVGYPKDELVGMNFLKLKLLPASQLAKAATILAKNALGKPSGPDEFTLQNKDRRQLEVEIS